MKPTQKSLALPYWVIFAILAIDQNLITAAENSGDLHEIVRGGTPASTIVIAEAPSPSAQLAAIEVQYAIERMTGVTIPILKDNQDVDGRRIVIGDNAVTRRLGLKADDYSRTEHLIEVESELIVLYGRDAESTIGKTIDFHKVTGRSGELQVRLPGMYEPQGSLRAAYHFLDRMLGVRYYGPRDYQCHFPESNSLTIPVTRVRRAPVIKYTNGLSSDQGGGVAWPIQKILYDDPTTDEVLLFARRLGTGGKPWYVNHTYEHLKYKARFGKEPDPRYPRIHEGYRAEFWPPEGSPSYQLCYSSEALARQVAKDAADYFDGKLSDTPHGLPVQGMDVFPVVPNDAGNYCTCDRCRALLAPHKKRKLHGVFGEGTATDYVFNFANMVARHLRKTHPDKTIAVLAYEGYIWEPVSIELEPNVVGAPCILNCSHWHDGQRDNDWKAYEFWAGQAKRNGLPFYLWNYYHHPEEIGAIRKHKVFPQFTPSKIHEWSKRYKRDGVEGVFLCGWGEGLDFYVLMKSFDDPDFDLDSVLNEYFSLSVGSEAAPHLRKFHDLIESISFDRKYFGDAINERVFWGLQGTREHLDALEAHLLDTELAINSEDKLAQRRFAPWRRLMEYMNEGHAEWKAKKKALLGKPPHTTIARGYIDPVAVHASGGDRHYRLVTGHHMIEAESGVFGTKEAKLNITNDGDRGFEFWGGPDKIHVTFDLGEIHELDEIRIWNFQQNRGYGLNRKGMKNFAIDVSHDSDQLSSWRRFTEGQIPIADDSAASEVSLVVPGESAKARYVRITAVGGPGQGNWATPGYNSSTFAGLGQVRFYGKPARNNGAE